jgi:hypothetical protein
MIVLTKSVRKGVYVVTGLQKAKGRRGVANMYGIQRRNCFCKITFAL